MTASLAYDTGPLAGLPRRSPAADGAAVVARIARDLGPLLNAEEAAVSARISAITLAPRAADRLDCQPVTLKRQGAPFAPLVAIMRDETIIALVDADAARRLAMAQSQLGRGGAALDLMQAADQAEEISRLLQRASN